MAVVFFESVLCAQGITESEIQQYLNGIEVPITGWQNDAVAFFNDSTESFDEGLKKRFSRWLAKNSGRMNYTGAPSNATNTDLANFLDANNLMTGTYCTTGGANPWELLGPISSPGKMQVNGLFLCVTVHPDNKDIVYAGTEFSGLWKGVRSSVDNQFYWNRITIDNSYAAIGVSAIELLPGSNPGVDDELIIGTNRNYAQVGYGIFRSTNAGTTWSKVNLVDQFPTSGGSSVEFARIVDIKRSPHNSNIMLACGSDRLWYSSDGGLNWGLIHDEIPSGSPHTFMFTDMEFSLSGGVNVAYIAGHNPNGSNPAPAKIYKLTGFSLSQSGTLHNMDLPLMSSGYRKTSPTAIAVSPADPDYFYFLTHDNNNQNGKYVYVMHHNASAWTTPTHGFTAPISTSTPDNLLLNAPVFQISERPTNGQRITHMYCGGIYMHRTSDGGSTWQRVSRGQTAPGDFVHVDIRGAYYWGYQNSEDILFIANDGGISFSDVSGLNNTWENINDYGINSLDTEKPGIAFISDRVIVGAWHNGVQFLDSDMNDWQYNGGGDMGEHFVNNLIDGGNFGYRIFMEEVSFFNNAAFGGPILKKNVLYNGSKLRPRIQININNPIELFIADKKLYLHDGLQTHYNNFAPHISLLFEHPVVRVDDRISAFKVSQSGIAYVAFGHGNADNNHAKVFKLDVSNTPVTATDLTPYLDNTTGNPNSDGHVNWLDWHHINDFIIDSEDPNIVFACFSDFSTSSIPGRVVYSIDGGVTWKEFSNGLPLIPINRLILRSGRELYAATDQGVYKADYVKNYDGNGDVTGFNAANWQCFNNNFPNAAVNGLTLNTCKDELYASTWGYGVYKVELDPLPTFSDSHRNIATSQTWDGVREITDNLTIDNGVTLTITGKVYMHGNNNYIEIAPGGQLIVDGGTITSNCKFWSGIYVDGNSTVPQYPANQGKITLINGATISNARDAITNTTPDWIPNTTGGIIYADDANFINNRRDVQLLSFCNFEAPSDGSYLAEFYNCKFERNNMFNIEAMTSSISMWDVQGVIIQDCEFQNLNTNDFEYTGQAIFTNDASFKVSGNSSFKGYGDAIRAINYTSGGAAHPIVIQDATFENNLRSIYLRSANFAKVASNNIEVPTTPDPNTGGEFTNPTVYLANYGIYMDHSSDYQLQSNVLMTQGSGLEPTIGIVLNNNGPAANLVWGNEIDHFEVGIEAIGKNRDSQLNAIGLVFKCNELGSSASQSSSHGNLTDIFIYDDGPFTGQSGVAGMQGANTSAADLPNNLFSPSGAMNIENTTGNSVVYYYGQGNARLEPVNVVNVVTSDVQDFVNLSIHCQGPGKTGLIIEGDYLNEIAQLESTLASKLVLRDQLINGGSTPALEAQILFAESQQDYQDLYVDLMDAAPYVEEAILMDVLYLEDFPELALRNLFVANPHVAREPHVLDELYSYEPPLSQQTLDDIEAEEKTFTAYDVLNMEIIMTQSASEYASVELVELYNSADSGDAVSNIAAHLKDRDEPHFWYAMIDMLIKDGQVDQASDALDTLASLGIFTDAGEAEFMAMQSFYNLVLSHSDSLTNLDSTSLGSLQNMANDSSGFGVTGRAISLLQLAGTGIEYAEPMYLPTGVSGKKSDKRGTVKRPQLPSLAFRLNPNPVDNYTHLYWDKEELFSHDNFDIVIRDLSGKTIAIIPKVQSQLEWYRIDMASYKVGAYLLSIESQGQVLYKEKLIIKAQ